MTDTNLAELVDGLSRLTSRRFDYSSSHPPSEVVTELPRGYPGAQPAYSLALPRSDFPRLFRNQAPISIFDLSTFAKSRFVAIWRTSYDLKAHTDQV